MRTAPEYRIKGSIDASSPCYRRARAEAYQKISLETGSNGIFFEPTKKQLYKIRVCYQRTILRIIKKESNSVFMTKELGVAEL